MNKSIEFVGVYSKNAANIFGTSLYFDIDGNEIEVTGVCRKEALTQSLFEYDWPDKKVVSTKLVEFCRLGRKARSYITGGVSYHFLEIYAKAIGYDYYWFEDNPQIFEKFCKKEIRKSQLRARKYIKERLEFKEKSMKNMTKENLKNANKAKANTIMYILQDMLDDISTGTPIILEDFEDKVFKIIEEDPIRYFDPDQKIPEKA